MVLTILAHIVVCLLIGAFIAGLVVDEDFRNAFLSVFIMVAFFLGTYLSVMKVVSYWQEKSSCTGNTCYITQPAEKQ